MEGDIEFTSWHYIFGNDNLSAVILSLSVQIENLSSAITELSNKLSSS